MSRIPEVTTVDFESMGILARPHYPPVPVSVSIKECRKKKPTFLAWGHITGGNNCSWQAARDALGEAWERATPDHPLLFQNAKFDLAVAEDHFDLALPSWDCVHDTLFLLFLDDPRQTELSLKPAAERILGWAPEERDAVAEWLIKNQPISGKKISKAKGPNYWGAFIAYCPGDIVGKYADGDVLRTEALYKRLYPTIITDSRAKAYDRERRTMMVLLDMEKQGVPVDHERLSRDTEIYTNVHELLTNWIRTTIKADSSVNLDSGAQLLEALKKVDMIDESKLLITAKGGQSTSKESLSVAVSNPRILAALAYRAELSTCLNTFMSNWLNTADLSGGRIFTNWNQVRQPNERGKGTAGARTGRLSSNPNFQNMPNVFQPHFQHLAPEGKRKGLPKAPFELPTLPIVRSYIAPFDGHVLIDRDYSQQELRILGHYEEGPLFEAYLADHWMDVHDWAKDEINEMLGTDYPRKPIKNIGFGLLYGMGLGLLAQKADTNVETARKLKSAYLTVAPGLKEMYKAMRQVAKDGDFITTWGGRQYMCEEPVWVKGQLREFDYKLVNVLIQGSAADITKEAFVRYYEMKDPEDKLLLTVHDELLASVPRGRRDDGMEIMRAAMESIELDVPLLSEGDWSETNWSDMKVYDARGERV